MRSRQTGAPNGERTHPLGKSTSRDRPARRFTGCEHRSGAEDDHRQETRDLHAYNNPSGQELIEAEAAEFWQSYFGRDTGERLTDRYTTPDGLTLFVLQFTRPDGREPTQTFEVEMNDDGLVRIDDRGQAFDELLATNAVDEVLQAFIVQDLSAIFGDDVVYTSPSNVDFVGSQAVTRWQGAFGATAERTSGVFALGDATYGFNVDWIEPDSGRASWTDDRLRG